MGFFRNLFGVITLQVESADLTGFLSSLSEKGICVTDLRLLQGLSARMNVAGKDLNRTLRIARRKGASIRILSQTGLYWSCLQLLHRPVLLTGLCILIFLTFYLPERILFVRITGNSRVPARQILECVQELGLCFGADRSSVRSEIIKNGLLEKMEDLQWVGVNSAGCVATVHVRERAQESGKALSGGVSSIIAQRDGVILSCTGVKGNMLCKPGQAVRAGDLLISGYTDCGFSIRAEHAQGEIYAQTTRSLQLVLPAFSSIQKENPKEIKKYGIQIGKKRINFYKDSGILPTGCDKICTWNYLVLPGGFQLPVAIVEETWYTYDSTVISASEASVKDTMECASKDYVISQMLGGEILQSNTVLDAQEDVWILRAEYICTEMIGRVRSEEIIKPDE